VLVTALVGLVGGVLVWQRKGQELRLQREIAAQTAERGLSAEQRETYESVIGVLQGLITPLKEHAEAVDKELSALRTQAAAQAVATAAAAQTQDARIAVLAAEHGKCLQQVAYLSARMAAIETAHAEAMSSGDTGT
jgi:prefoldin subunit 5